MGQGRLWPAGEWHSRSAPSSANTRAFWRLRFLALFRRRPPQGMEGFVMPASKNLHNSRRAYARRLRENHSRASPRKSSMTEIRCPAYPAYQKIAEMGLRSWRRSALSQNALGIPTNTTMRLIHRAQFCHLRATSQIQTNCATMDTKNKMRKPFAYRS
jgi:hypothetical protein